MPLLLDLGMPMEEVAQIMTAVGNHEEQNGRAVSEITAALIIADKSDAHRTRVRRNKPYDPTDIHDRVNNAIKKNSVTIDRENHIISFEILMDDSSSIMDFLEIYLSRMLFSERAAEVLGCSFRLIINGMLVNNLNPKA